MQRNGKAKRFSIYDDLDIITANRVEELLANLTSERMQNIRGGMANGVMDPRRNINYDCGYPETGSITAEGLKDLYMREPVAARVVELMPKECWQQSPTIYETDDQERETPFEKAWDELEVAMSGGVSWHQTEEGSSIWEYLFRADVLSGIGSFGVLLMGFDDGKNLQDPVDGAIIPAENPQPYQSSMTPTGSPRVVPPTRNQRWKPAMPDGWMTEDEEHALLNPQATKVWNGKRDEKGKAVLEERKPITANARQQEIIKEWRAQRERMVANAQKQGVSGETFLVNAYNAAQNPGVVPQYDLQIGQPKPMAEGALAGTDQQYFAPIQGPSEMPAPAPSTKPVKLLFLRAFDESLVQIVRYEWNIRNPRFGLPVMYRITLNDPREQHTGVGLPLATVYVHWSRVIHIADVNHQQNSSEIFAAPRMRPVLNPLLDIIKISGASGEGYWQSCNEKLSFETIPQLGGDVDIDDEQMADLYERIIHGQQRAYTLRGMTTNAVAPTVTDPTPHFDMCIKRICIKMGCPVPVFQGYEIGEQASENNDDTWDGRVAQRQKNYLIPREIVPFVDRLITVGVLPEPTGYTVEWAAPDNLSDDEKSKIGLTKTQALAAYVAGNCEAVVPPINYLEDFLGIEDEKAQAYIDAAAKATEQDMMTMPAPGELGHPATPQEPPEPPPALPIKVKGADGAEKLVHPDSVKPPADTVDEPAGNSSIAPHLKEFGIDNALSTNIDTPEFRQAAVANKERAMQALHALRGYCLTLGDVPDAIVANVKNVTERLYAVDPADDAQAMAFVYGDLGEPVANADEDALVGEIEKLLAGDKP